MKNISKKFLFFFTLFLILLLYIILSPALGSPFYYIPYLFIPAAIALFVTFIFAFIIDLVKKTGKSWNFLYACLALSASLYVGIKIIDLQIEQSKSSAGPVINSLQKYYSDNNKFPDNINELTPKYIDDIPKSNMGFIGSSYVYKSQTDNRDFWLSFEELNSYKWIYINSRNIWVYDD
ncbi:MAG: hypothetical protein EHM58_13985 [Ignavibacteriae bacterium]|nr:MAG: hypothetical protein EHM58_13985 [Ignavibacteriota bacterium]